MILSLLSIRSKILLPSRGAQKARNQMTHWETTIGRRPLGDEAFEVMLEDHDLASEIIEDTEIKRYAGLGLGAEAQMF